MSTEASAGGAREQVGLEIMEALAITPGGSRRFADVDQDLAKDLERWLNEFCFGDVWGRSGLDLETKRLLTITTLAVLNRERQLRFHVKSGLEQGVTSQAILGALMHLVAYAGFPTAIAAIECAVEEITTFRNSTNSQFQKEGNTP